MLCSSFSVITTAEIGTRAISREPSPAGSATTQRAGAAVRAGVRGRASPFWHGALRKPSTRVYRASVVPLLRSDGRAHRGGSPRLPGTVRPVAVRRSPSRLAEVEARLRGTPSRWLVTGAAGFIGSHLVERLLQLGQMVVGLDNFATGSARNLDDVLRSVAAAGERLALIEGDVRDQATCRRACQGVDVILHQAALGSVPRSIDDPETTNAVNVNGFLNMLVAARDAKVARFVYTSSSAVYGDDPRLPKREGNEGTPLSPYAVTKVANELYAGAFQRAYGLEVIGLRYFNVFGPRQDPNGPYAAVIPRWIGALMRGDPCTIYGDGETSRDFCYVANVVQANLLAAHAAAPATGDVYNVSYGRSTSLNELYLELRGRVQRLRPEAALADRIYEPFRPGDVRHSLASVKKAKEALGYRPTHDLLLGLDEAMPWYAERVA